MANTPDIARVVSLIMENPRLIEEISSMVNNSGDEHEGDEVARSEEKKDPDTAQASQNIEKEERTPSRKNRSELLSALKPYVSKERAQAIDSMITIVNILDTMKGR